MTMGKHSHRLTQLPTTHLPSLAARSGAIELDEFVELMQKAATKNPTSRPSQVWVSAIVAHPVVVTPRSTPQ